MTGLDAVAAGRRRRALRGLPALPVPGVGGEEPGALAVRGAVPGRCGRGRPGRAGRPAGRAAARATPATRLELRVRFLQVQARTVEAATGAGSPTSTRCASGDASWIPWHEAVDREQVAGVHRGRRARRPERSPSRPRRRGRQPRRCPPAGWCGPAGHWRPSWWLGAAAGRRPAAGGLGAAQHRDLGPGDSTRDRVAARRLGQHPPAARVSGGAFVSLPAARRTPRLPERRLVARAGRRRRLARAADRPAGPARDRAGEPGRPLRRHRDRRDPHPAGDDDDRRGEGRGPRHRPPGGGHHRPLRHPAAGAVMERLHGARRDVDPPPAADVPWWDPGADAAVSPETDSVLVAGVPVSKGSRVRLRPTRRRRRAGHLPRRAGRRRHRGAVRRGR